MPFSKIGSLIIDRLIGKEKIPIQKELPGFYLGKAFDGYPFYLSERNLSYHIEIVAPTGGGKTNLLKNLIFDRIKKGHGVIFLDFKAEFDLISWLYCVCKQFRRVNDMRLLSLSNRDLSVPYNPFKFGDATSIHSALMSSMIWSESFYRSVASVTLMTLIKSLCEYRDKTGNLFHLGHLYDLLEDTGKIRALADRMAQLNCPMAYKLSELASKLDKYSEKEKLQGLIANLNQILFSSAGELLSSDVIHESFGFKEAIENGLISVMLMNSLKLKESAQIIGKIILQDLMNFIGDRYAQFDPKRHKPITLIIDEFASFAMPEFIEFMDRARGAGIGIVIAHQARADLRSISPEFGQRIEANSNTTIVSGLKDSKDAEYYAGILGTKTTIKETIHVAPDLFFGEVETGMKSIREAEEFVLHPNYLKNLHQGQVFSISRTIDPRWALLNIPPAVSFKNVRLSQDEIIFMLKKVREDYMIQGTNQYLNLHKLVELRLRSKNESINNVKDQSPENWR